VIYTPAKLTISGIRSMIKGYIAYEENLNIFYSNIINTNSIDNIFSLWNTIKKYIINNNITEPINNLPSLYPYLMTNRNLTKKVFMCYTYGQLYRGRIDEIIDILKNSNISINENLYEEISLFSKNYPIFINKLFGGLTRCLNKLQKLNKHLLELNGGKIVIKTLDGSFCTWTIFHNQATKSKSNYNPLTKKHQAIRILDNSLKNKINYAKMARSFIPGLIHSIDAGVIRLLIWRTYTKAGKTIVTCNDPIQYHPELENEIEIICKYIRAGNTIKFRIRILFKTKYCKYTRYTRNLGNI